MIPETKQEEQERLWLIFSGKVGDHLTFSNGKHGTIIKKTPCYMMIQMQEGYTNILFKDKIHFN